MSIRLPRSARALCAETCTSGNAKATASRVRSNLTLIRKRVRGSIMVGRSVDAGGSAPKKRAVAKRRRPDEERRGRSESEQLTQPPNSVRRTRANRAGRERTTADMRIAALEARLRRLASPADPHHASHGGHLAHGFGRKVGVSRGRVRNCAEKPLTAAPEYCLIGVQAMEVGRGRVAEQ